ncbi:ABC transporter ATP-binding protein [Vreelandella jeotgali]|uniref:ABC transporter ATP-binding protein n=1 Tax=Vreelandella jeotgali TaxID=553386 RepID=UPI0003478574|nr:ABC transporter ATP-binding protein [Halomonas jeotgali]
MLSLRDLYITRGRGHERYAVHLPELRLDAGEVVAVVGPSGCGKSTLLEAIGLLLEPDRPGHFTLGRQKQDLARLWQQDDAAALATVRSRDMGFMLQNGGLLPYLSVRDNIALPRQLLGLTAKSARVDHACETLGLTPLLDKRPAALSIGERQRSAFVRAIAHEPALLLADEPTAALDPHAGARLFGVMTALVQELEMAALVVSHDRELVAEFALRRMVASLTTEGCRFDAAP